jgi:hypothetical protein
METISHSMADNEGTDQRVEALTGAEHPMSSDNVPEFPEADVLEKRRPGRQKGLGKVKGSGRKPGQPNKITKDIKETIMKRGKPLELLCDVVRGKKIRVGPQAGPGEPKYVYPTLQDRVSAARVLIGKVAPDMKATELSGPDGAAVAIKTDSGLDPAIELARRFSFIIAAGEAATDERELPKANRQLLEPIVAKDSM